MSVQEKQVLVLFQLQAGTQGFCLGESTFLGMKDSKTLPEGTEFIRTGWRNPGLRALLESRVLDGKP